MSASRRLPVYLLLDCSGSMSGEPIQAVQQGVKALLSELRSDPMALETAYLSIITFESSAHELLPLTELAKVKAPKLTAGGATSLGAALKLLDKCVGRDIRQSTSEQKGDWKPLVFLMTDGVPTDSWETSAERLKKKLPANIIACAAGSGSDETILKKITESVVKLDNLQPETLKAFFKWVSSSVKVTSQSMGTQVVADNAPMPLPAPPPQITIIP